MKMLLVVSLLVLRSYPEIEPVIIVRHPACGKGFLGFISGCLHYPVALLPVVLQKQTLRGKIICCAAINQKAFFPAFNNLYDTPHRRGNNRKSM
jgi:hypothetical protein